MFINGMSVYRWQTPWERSKANISIKYQVRLATFHIDFAKNVMFQMNLREEDGENLHLQVIKLFKCFLKLC